MDRWDEGLAPGILRPNLVGKFGEAMAFQSLPQPLQTQDWQDFLVLLPIKHIYILYYIIIIYIYINLAPWEYLLRMFSFYDVGMCSPRALFHGMTMLW